MSNCNEHQWEPWDSDKGIIYCRKCNARTTQYELSYRTGQDRKTNIIIVIGLATLLVATLSIVIQLFYE